MDVPIVAASGNDGQLRPGIDHYPALLAKGKGLPIIVAGAVDQFGNSPPWVQSGTFLTTSAGGVDISCAGGYTTDEYRLMDGTTYGKFKPFAYISKTC